MSARHAVVFARVKAPGLPEARMHVVYAADDGLDPQPFEPWIRYVLETDGLRRVAWQRASAGVVCLLLDFTAAIGESEDTLDTNALRAFAEALLSGTRHLGDGPLRALSWPPRSRNRARDCLRAVTAFLDWLCERTGRPRANPWRAATSAERLVRMRHLDKRAARSLLSHAAYRHRDAVAAGQVRAVQVSQAHSSAALHPVRAFDETAFERLLTHGFARSAPPLAPLHRRLRLRDAMIAVLLHGGGLRLSEPFHLYLGDVRGDPQRPGSAQVRLFHPEQGQAPVENNRRWRDREHYLRERWLRLPRTLERGRFHAGWKKLALADGHAKCAYVEWFPAFWGEVFWSLFRVYLVHRPRANHPFLFVSEHRHHRGEPYTLESFTQAHARAVERIGLVPRKAAGSSPHGHRHAYGKRLRQARVDPLFIQRAMHHASPQSQQVYTTPDMAELRAALCEAEAHLEARRSSNIAELNDDAS